MKLRRTKKLTKRVLSILSSEEAETIIKTALTTALISQGIPPPVAALSANVAAEGLCRGNKYISNKL